MSPDISELLKKALALPPEARAALAGSLLESLDDTVDPSVEEAWKHEIAKRIEELDSGKVKPIPWAEARRQITALLNGRYVSGHSPVRTRRTQVFHQLVPGTKQSHRR